MQESFSKLYLDFNGLMKVTLEPIRYKFEILSSKKHAFSHLTTYIDASNNTYFMTSNPNHDIDIYKIVQTSYQEFKPQFQTTVKISGRGYACSAFKGNNFFVGCKDGTLLKINCKTFKVEREMENDLPIHSIIFYEHGMLILAHSVQSGYLEDRSMLQIVIPDKDWGF